MFASFDNSLSDGSKLLLKVGASILGVILGFSLLGFLLINSGRSEGELRALLKNSSWEMSQSTDGTDYKLELVFEEDEFTYKAIVDGEELILAELPYKVTSGSEILAGPYEDGVEKSFELEFNDNETVMAMSPSISGDDSKDNWYLKTED